MATQTVELPAWQVAILARLTPERILIVALIGFFAYQHYFGSPLSGPSPVAPVPQIDRVEDTARQFRLSWPLTFTSVRDRIKSRQITTLSQLTDALDAGTKSAGDSFAEAYGGELKANADSSNNIINPEGAAAVFDRAMKGLTK